MGYQRALRQPVGRRARRRVDEDEVEGRRAATRRPGRTSDEDESEWDVGEWSSVLYTARIRNAARLR